MRGLIIVGIFIVLLFVATMPVTAELEGWQFQREITIHENSGKTLEEYQVLLDLSGSNFPVTAKADGSDLRFVLDGEELSYWIEEFDLGVKTGKVWVKVPSIPANGETKIEMYYGNPSAGAVSNGDKTFEFFDDFDSGKLDKWVIRSGDWSIENGELAGRGTKSKRDTITTVREFPVDRVVEVDVKHITLGHLSHSGIILGNTNPSDGLNGGNDCIRILFFDRGDYMRLDICGYGLEEQHKAPIEAQTGIWNHIKYQRLGKNAETNYKVWVNGEQKFDVSETLDTSTWKYFGLWVYLDGYAHFDNVRIRKYTPPVPTVTFSSEQPVSAITITKSIPSTDMQEVSSITATITIKNIGSKPITNIKVTDALPSAFKLVSGSLSKTIPRLDAGESSTLEYTFEPVGMGSIALPKAIATYGDKTASSRSIAANIIAKDSDNDDLSDNQELQLGTDPNKADTDGDGLLDKRELDRGLNPLLPDTDGDGINDNEDVYPLDKDNDGIPDAEDTFPTIPQIYIYGAFGLLILACIAGAGVMLKRNANKRRSRDFYDNLNVAITPETDSYEIGDTVSFVITVSNRVGDITSGYVESSTFNRIEFTRIKRGEKYSGKVTVVSESVGKLVGTATAVVKDESGNEHMLKTSFAAEITPHRPKLTLELANEKVVKPLEQSYIMLSITNRGRSNAEKVSLDVNADSGIEIGTYSPLEVIESNSMGKVRIPYTCLCAGEFNVKIVARYHNGNPYQEAASLAVQTLPLKPEGRLTVELPQSMKLGEDANGLLTIRNAGEDAMLNARTGIKGMDVTIPVFSRIEPKKEVMEQFPVTFSSHGTKPIKFVVDFEDEIGKRYSIAEEKSILVRGLVLKPSIRIDVPALIREEVARGTIIVRNEGEENIKSAHLTVSVNGEKIKVAELGDIEPQGEKTTAVTVKIELERAEIVANLAYKDILGNDYTYQERSSIAVRERTVLVTSAVNYQGTVILYKAKVENKLPKPISDIRIKANVPDVFTIKKDGKDEKTISILEPGNAQTVTFEIRPNEECGERDISGRVIYYNHLIDRREDIEIPVKSVSIICPLLKAREISEEAWDSQVSRLIGAGENTKDEIPIAAKSLFTMVIDIVKHLNLYVVEKSVTDDGSFFRGVARFYGVGIKDLKYAAEIEAIGQGTEKSQLIIKTWAEREDALIGFYYKILDEIEKRTRIKEYVRPFVVGGDYLGPGAIKTVGDTGFIKGGVGSTEKPISKCPRCGREVSGDERFCPQCGKPLK